MATLIKVDGRREHVELPRQDAFAKVRELLGGWAEVVHCKGLDPGIVMLVDSDGRDKKLSVNITATELYRGNPARHDGFIVGDVILASVYNPGKDNERWE
jgi:hypothetical protein